MLVKNEKLDETIDGPSVPWDSHRHQPSEAKEKKARDLWSRSQCHHHVANVNEKWKGSNENQNDEWSEVRDSSIPRTVNKWYRGAFLASYVKGGAKEYKTSTSRTILM